MRDAVQSRIPAAEKFAHEWVTAWNAHSIDQVMSHYADDVVVKSPFLAQALPDSGGTVSDVQQLREIYSKAFVKYPQLKFELIRVFASTESVVIHYKSVENLLAAETFWLNADGKAKLVLCHYALA